MHKTEIAKEYLKDAIELYDRGRFFSAMSLAAIAEELFGKAIDHLPKKIADIGIDTKNALAHDVSSELTFQKWCEGKSVNGHTFGKPQTEKKIRDLINFPKNSAKHFNDPNEDSVKMDDLKYSAGRFICRAIDNFSTVFPAEKNQYTCKSEDIQVYQLNRNFGRMFPKRNQA